MKEAIDRTRKYLKTSENPLFWSIYIVRELCNNHHILAIKWAAECIRICLFKSELPKITELEKYIQQALDSQDISASECFKISRKIWDLKPGRDCIQTSTSGLWAAIGDYKRDNKPSIMLIASTVYSVSTEDELVTLDPLKRRSINNYRLSELYIETALKIYNEYKAKK